MQVKFLLPILTFVYILNEKHLHIVSFNVPYPPDYGGIIDVFHKIRSLSNAGVGVILHAFEYERPRAPELKDFCEKVYYYPRKTGWRSQMSLKPYIIYSRRSPELLKNLKGDPWPVLFEGLHCTYYLNHPDLLHKLRIVRTHNIEHQYYMQLARTTQGLSSRVFHSIEAWKLKRAEKVLRQADEIAAISRSDKEYLDRKVGGSFLLNPFHSNDKVDILPGRGDYLLFHGNLSVSENVESALFLIRKVFSKLDVPVVIAGKNPVAAIEEAIRPCSHIRLVSSPGKEEMRRLIRHAHANILVTFQDTGIKLKLIESLFAGRFCIVNRTMVDNTGLEELCEIGNTPAELIVRIRQAMNTEFDEGKIWDRTQGLMEYDNALNAAKLMLLL